MRRSFTIAVVLTSLALLGAGQVSATNLVANWTFNQPTGAMSIPDASGNGHTATLQGTDTLTSIPGQIGTGLMFNGASGTGNYLSVPDAKDYFSGENKLTISCWVYWPTGTAGLSQISQLFSVGYYNGGPQGYKFGFYSISSGGRMSFNTGTPAASSIYPSFWSNIGGVGPDYTAGQWDLLTVEYDGMDSSTSTDRLEMYVNGVTVHAGSYRPPSGQGPYYLPTAAVGQVLEIAGGENGWYGGLNDMGIWNAVLTGGANAIGANNRGTSGGEVQAMYTTPTCGITALSQYGVLAMDQLFTIYNNANPSATTPVTTSTGTLNWQYVASGLPGSSGGAGLAAGGTYAGDYYVQLDGNGGGVVAAPVTTPEPGTLMLLTAGLAGLLAYAWRRRR
jgi:hypothetical protein